jgi:hypothetical protein
MPRPASWPDEQCLLLRFGADVNTAAEIDGVYRHTSAESIFIPGTTSGNNPGNGTFANKAADFHGVCPPMCKKIVAIKDVLIHQ